ncbi:uncharacterized protein LOC136714005 isoform X2 [Amia ocellicauda]|uniref:uncharacterized protein LOC136714005 isoform X2 n=1 Tax=Amia ocellicauda TaxID=2972642 RepID=UPI003463F588
MTAREEKQQLKKEKDQGKVKEISGAESGWTGQVFCQICQLLCTNYDLHLNGKKHNQKLANLRKQEKHGGVDPEATQGGPEYAQEKEPKKRKKERKELGDPPFCKLCQFQSLNRENFHTHLCGKKHQKKVLAIRSAAADPKANTGPALPLKDYIKSKKRVEPIIGLQFVTECRISNSPKSPVYLCHFCSESMNKKQIILHLTSWQHRFAYLVRKFPELLPYGWMYKNFEHMESVLQHRASTVEMREGPGQCEIIILPDTYNYEEVQVVRPCSNTGNDSNGTAARPMTLQQYIGDPQRTQPLLGLRFLTEFRQSDGSEPHVYLCEVCKKKVSDEFILSHMTGFKHVVSCLEHLGHNPLDKDNLPKDVIDRSKVLTEMAKQVKETEAPEDVQIMKLNPLAMKQIRGMSVHFALKMMQKIKKASGEQGAGQPEDGEIQKMIEELMADQTGVDTDTKSNSKGSTHTAQKQQSKPVNRAVEEGPTLACSVVLVDYLKSPFRTEPVIGLSSIIECRSSIGWPPPYYYLCELCTAKMREDYIISHIISSLHRFFYIKACNPSLLDSSEKDPQLSTMGPFLHKTASDLQEQEGHGEVQVVTLSHAIYNKIVLQSYQSAYMEVKDARQYKLGLFTGLITGLKKPTRRERHRTRKPETGLDHRTLKGGSHTDEPAKYSDHKHARRRPRTGHRSRSREPAERWSGEPWRSTHDHRELAGYEEITGDRGHPQPAEHFTPRHGLPQYLASRNPEDIGTSEGGLPHMHPDSQSALMHQHGYQGHQQLDAQPILMRPLSPHRQPFPKRRPSPMCALDREFYPERHAGPHGQAFPSGVQENVFPDVTPVPTPGEGRTVLLHPVGPQGHTLPRRLPAHLPPEGLMVTVRPSIVQDERFPERMPESAVRYESRRSVMLPGSSLSRTFPERTGQDRTAYPNRTESKRFAREVDEGGKGKHSFKEEKKQKLLELLMGLLDSEGTEGVTHHKPDQHQMMPGSTAPLGLTEHLPDRHSGTAPPRRIHPTKEQMVIEYEYSRGRDDESPLSAPDLDQHRSSWAGGGSGRGHSWGMEFDTSFPAVPGNTDHRKHHSAMKQEESWATSQRGEGFSHDRYTEELESACYDAGRYAGPQGGSEFPAPAGYNRVPAKVGGQNVSEFLRGIRYSEDRTRRTSPSGSHATRLATAPGEGYWGEAAAGRGYRDRVQGVRDNKTGGLVGDRWSTNYSVGGIPFGPGGRLAAASAYPPEATQGRQLDRTSVLGKRGWEKLDGFQPSPYGGYENWESQSPRPPPTKIPGLDQSDSQKDPTEELMKLWKNISREQAERHKGSLSCRRLGVWQEPHTAASPTPVYTWRDTGWLLSVIWNKMHTSEVGFSTDQDFGGVDLIHPCNPAYTRAFNSQQAELKGAVVIKDAVVL